MHFAVDGASKSLYLLTFMTRGNLPPQAYTKEVLAQAVTWLQAQPDHIKALVNSQDALVSLYLKVKRNGEATLETLSPASAEKFRTDLKAIAAEMQQFAVPLSSQSVSHPSIPPPSIPPQGAFAYGNQTATPSQGAASPVSETGTASPAKPAGSHSGETQKVQSLSSELDPHSLGIIRDVKQRFNLSSESEALRLLIAVGYDKVRGVLPS